MRACTKEPGSFAAASPRADLQLPYSFTFSLDVLSERIPSRVPYSEQLPATSVRHPMLESAVRRATPCASISRLQRGAAVSGLAHHARCIQISGRTSWTRRSKVILLLSSPIRTLRLVGVSTF